jgi:hypothetical protein
MNEVQQGDSHVRCVGKVDKHKGAKAKGGQHAVLVDGLPRRVLAVLGLGKVRERGRKKVNGTGRESTMVVVKRREWL